MCQLKKKVHMKPDRLQNYTKKKTTFYNDTKYLLVKVLQF